MKGKRNRQKTKEFINNKTQEGFVKSNKQILFTISVILLGFSNHETESSHTLKSLEKGAFLFVGRGFGMSLGWCGGLQRYGA
jgi:hypothetical protein